MLGSIEEDEDDEAVAVEQTVQIEGTVRVEENVDDKEMIVISETEETVEVKTAVVEGSIKDKVDIVSN